MLELANAMGKSALLMAIHLNDLGITRKKDYFVEMLDIFGLNLNDVSWKRIEMVDPTLIQYQDKQMPEEPIKGRK